MSKPKIDRINALYVSGVLNLQEMKIQVEEKSYDIQELLADFDECDITIRIRK